MSLWRRIIHSTFFIKLRHWEYWPFGIVQFPLFFYYPWLSLRAGSLTFFSASNPGILMGGMFGESKYDVLKLVPQTLRPATILFKRTTDSPSIDAVLSANQMSFPLIFKPDIGERGFMVKRIDNIDQAQDYMRKMPHDFLIQELVTLPMEFGVFYERHPSSATGRVTSVVMKEMLYVEGNGLSTLEELILNKERAKIQWPVLREKFKHDLHRVLPRGERLEIVSIGNHCLGTKFINANHLINDEMHRSFDRIANAIPGFFFGRFDLRCETIQDLRNGRVLVLELNGCGAEPAHIYDPEFSFFKAVGVLLRHWRAIFDIARENKRLGTAYLPLPEAISHYHRFRGKTRPPEV